MNGMERYPHLFRPIMIGNQVFRSRICASPTGHQDISPEGYPSERTCAYYERKAEGGAASVTVGECVVDRTLGRGCAWHFAMDDPLAFHGLNKLTDAVRRHGAVVSAELCHSGKLANRAPAVSHLPAIGPMGEQVVMKGGATHDYTKDVRAMTEADIQDAIEKFASAAAFAKDCGFNMVTVHGAHGWLIAQFMEPGNTRTDGWGGSLENRMRFPIAICDAIRARVGKGFPIEFRMSGDECMEGGYSIEEGVKMAVMIQDHVDLIHVSGGVHEDRDAFSIMCPSMFREDCCNVKFAAAVKKQVHVPVACVGAINDPEVMEEIIASGKADLIMVGRGLIADPDLPNKVRQGRDREVRKCLRCMNCFSKLLRNGQFWCSINPETSRELDFRGSDAAVRPQKVLVVGGGVAGMQAALTCAQQGHKVILHEREGQLGGTLRCEHDVPFKRRLRDYLNQQAEQCLSHPNIEVHLNSEVTWRVAKATGADAIVAALGAHAARPPIPGLDGPNVFTGEALFRSPEQAGEKVVILGAGLVGCELGIYLSMLGKQVEIVEMTGRINDGGNYLHVNCMGTFLRKYHIEIHYNTRATAVDSAGVTAVDKEGKEIHFAADTVVCAMGQVPRAEAAMELYDCAPKFYQIGDCEHPANIQAATSTAYTIARDIGRG